ncbi:hypothetical protein F4778DRAFT_736310, partial [Xylariomycetidae sp. FL2044]
MNHSIARAPFQYPCVPYEDAPGGGEGFWSGFKPRGSEDDPKRLYDYEVTSLEPTFFY